MNSRPIGVFDSGIGGLTVAKEIIKQLPNESIIYLGDTARVPYGTRSNEVVTLFAKELADFLLKRNVKCLVVACNTISSVALKQIEKDSPIPVIGVVEPAAQKAVLNSKNKRIGVIGTTGTIQSKAYEQIIKRLYPEVKLFSLACPLFVPLAEEGLHSHLATKLIAEEYLKKFKSQKIDTLILGCTHYPLLLGVIKEVLGPEITLVDSALPTAEKLEGVLRKENLLNEKKNTKYKFFVTDAPERVYQVAGKFFGEALNGRLKKISLGD